MELTPGRNDSRFDVFPLLKKAVSGILSVAIVLFAFQAYATHDLGSPHDNGVAHVAAVDQHPGIYSHDSGSGPQDEHCSLAVCASFTIAPGGSDYSLIPSVEKRGFVLNDLAPNGILFVDDPPIPKLILV